MTIRIQIHIKEIVEKLNQVNIIEIKEIVLEAIVKKDHLRVNLILIIITTILQ